MYLGCGCSIQGCLCRLQCCLQLTHITYGNRIETCQFSRSSSCLVLHRTGFYHTDVIIIFASAIEEIVKLRHNKYTYVNQVAREKKYAAFAKICGKLFLLRCMTSQSSVNAIVRSYTHMYIHSHIPCQCMHTAYESKRKQSKRKKKTMWVHGCVSTW